MRHRLRKAVPFLREDQKNQFEFDVVQLPVTTVEDLQKKSDKIMKKVEEEMKDFDLSKSESNENSKVDMTNNEQLEIPFPED